MKVGYPDTMNSAAAASPMKARYASSGELGDLQAVKVEPGAFAGDGSGGAVQKIIKKVLLLNMQKHLLI